jgi:hypothetical protein
MWDLTEQELLSLGEAFEAQYKKILKQKIYPYGNPERGRGNKIATGNLYNSFKVKVVEDNEGLKLQVSYLDYFNYVNFGRRPGGKKVPIKALLSWIKVRNLRFRDEKGKFKKGSQMKLAWAIQTNIHKFGIRPANLFDKAYDSLEDTLINPPPQMARYYNLLYDAIGNDVENFIDKTVRELIKTDTAR